MVAGCLWGIQNQVSLRTCKLITRTLHIILYFTGSQWRFFYNQGNVIFMLGVSQNVSYWVPDQEKFLDQSLSRVPWNTGMWMQLSILGSPEVRNTGGEVSTVDSRHGEVWPNPGAPCLYSAWESTCPCTEHGFQPLSKRIPHASGQLGPWATTTEPASPRTHACNKQNHGNEKHKHSNYR